MKNYVKAIILSNIFDIVVSSILGGVFSFIVMNQYHLDLNTLGTNPSIFKDFLSAHPTLHLVLMIPGGIISIIAGFLAAKIAKDKFILMGAMSSILCMLGGLTSFSSESFLKGLFLIFLSPVLGVTGAYIFSKYAKKENTIIKELK